MEACVGEGVLVIIARQVDVPMFQSIDGYMMCSLLMINISNGAGEMINLLMKLFLPLSSFPTPPDPILSAPAASPLRPHPPPLPPSLRSSLTASAPVLRLAASALASSPPSRAGRLLFLLLLAVAAVVLRWACAMPSPVRHCVSCRSDPSCQGVDLGTA